MSKHQTKEKNEPKFYTKVGEIIGWYDNGVIRATGIPYAKAKRFGMPSPISKLETPFIADKPAPACPQAPADSDVEATMGGDTLRHLERDENCQNLSITLPDDIQSKEKLPVMVWVHGGAYVSGAGDATMFEPKSIVEEQQVIVVSVSYRLGIFGFLGGFGNRSANLGLFDLIEALKWIKNNIKDFGGDEENITLFGQSAGGDAIANLMIADGTKGLFQKVIIQSAPFGISKKRTQMTEKMKKIAETIKEELTSEEFVAYQDTITKSVQGFGLKAGMPFGVQYGCAPLPKEEDTDEMWQQKAKEYKLLIGYTQKETSCFIPGMKGLSKIWKIPLLGNWLKNLFIEVTTQSVFGRAANNFAKIHKKGKGEGYFYKITWGSKENDLGATHTIDLPLLFGNQEIWNNASLVKGISWEDIYIKGKMVREMWAKFARTGKLQSEGKIDGVLTYHKIN